MFLNLNIRNRRQKILHNISFETEVYDIYDPVFTSEEESETSSSDSSMTSRSSSANEEEFTSSKSSLSEDFAHKNGTNTALKE